MESGPAEKVKDGSSGPKPHLKAHVIRPAQQNSVRPAQAVAEAPPAAIKLRPFPIKEVARLLELYEHTYWANGRRKADVVRMLKHSPFTLSAWDGKKLVGFCRVLTDFVYRAALYDVIVHPDYRGRGAGRLLLEGVTNHPKLRRVERWFLSTRDKHAFYEQFGWTRSHGNVMELRREAGDKR